VCHVEAWDKFTFNHVGPKILDPVIGVITVVLAIPSDVGNVSATMYDELVVGVVSTKRNGG
jgi:hypothetical protein